MFLLSAVQTWKWRWKNKFNLVCYPNRVGKESMSFYLRWIINGSTELTESKLGTNTQQVLIQCS